MYLLLCQELQCAYVHVDISGRFLIQAIDSRLSISVAVGSIQVIRPVRDQLDKAFAQA